MYDLGITPVELKMAFVKRTLGESDSERTQTQKGNSKAILNIISNSTFLPLSTSSTWDLMKAPSLSLLHTLRIEMIGNVK